MSEFYLNPDLISKEEWNNIFTRLQKEAGSHSYSLPELKAQWLKAFERAVVERAKNKQVGVFFSGGLDSTFIAFILAKHKIPFTCYTVGFKDGNTKMPEDIVAARNVATHFGWKHKEWIMDTKELNSVLRKTTEILGETVNPVTVSVGAVVVAAAELAKKDSITVLFSGLGSEEIFAGYERHAKSGSLNDECWNGLFKMYERDMIRDAKIGTALNISVPTPFMDLEVIRLAMLIPETEKIVGDEKKYVLRVIAQEAGLPHEFAFRPKRAAQYGSRINKAIFRMGRKQGLKKGEYLDTLRDE